MYARYMLTWGVGGKKNALRVIFGRRQDPWNLL
jgi:hypothetical protein